jgi:hypothetical protein
VPTYAGTLQTFMLWRRRWLRRHWNIGRKQGEYMFRDAAHAGLFQERIRPIPIREIGLYDEECRMELLVEELGGERAR